MLGESGTLLWDMPFSPNLGDCVAAAFLFSGRDREASPSFSSITSSLMEAGKKKKEKAYFNSGTGQLQSVMKMV